MDHPNHLWIDNSGKNDRTNRVNYQSIENGTIAIKQSLYLIHLNKIHIYLKDRSQWNKGPQRRGGFIYNNVEYDLSLTDPTFSEFEEQDLTNKLVCLSLARKYKRDNFCYKITASIF